MCTGDGVIDGGLRSGNLDLDRTIGYARKTIQQAVRYAKMNRSGILELKIEVKLLRQ